MVNSTANQLPPEVLFEKQLGQLTTWARVMRQAGLQMDKALQRAIDDPEMRDRLVRFWNSGGFEPTTSQKRAREIMGRNMFGVEEAIRHFGVNPTKTQAAVLSEIPFSEATLEECKSTHVLVAVFPLSILEVRGKVPSDQRLFYVQDWYNKESFAKDKGEPEWQLICKAPVDNSTSKTWDEQQALLSDKEQTPKARVMVYAIIGHFISTGERLFEKIYVRCSDVDSDGLRVYVGNFGSDGLLVNFSWDGHRVGVLGLASARKSE